MTFSDVVSVAILLLLKAEIRAVLAVSFSPSAIVVTALVANACTHWLSSLFVLYAWYALYNDAAAATFCTVPTVVESFLYVLYEVYES